MIPKQDRTPVRKATDIEQKYNLDQNIDEVMKVATNAQRAATNAVSVANNAASVAASANATAEQNRDGISGLNERVGTLEETGGGVDLSVVYPVGSIYLSVLATNPADLFGFGTWVQIKDKFLLSAGDTYAAGSEGGEADHTLTEGEMPSHSHGGYVDFNQGDITWRAATDWTTPLVHKTFTQEQTASRITGYTGGSQPHNNMPPYLAVYVWQRTA